MKKRITLIMFSCLLFGCTTTLTSEGQSIKVIDENAARECEFIDFINEVDVRGNSANKRMHNAIVKAKNKSSGLGADSLQILTSGYDVFVGGMVTANAYRCGN